jgi:hypothetical protein
MSVNSEATTISDSEDLWDYQSCIEVVGRIVTEIVQSNNKQLFNDKINNILFSNFNAKKVPSITLSSYITRIVKYSNLDESTLICSLIYLDRICETHGLQITELNVHRLILTSIILSIKYNEDDYYSNLHYAKVGGISIIEMNSLEIDFMRGIQYSLFIEEDLFDKYRSYLIQYNTKKMK